MAACALQRRHKICQERLPGSDPAMTKFIATVWLFSETGVVLQSVKDDRDSKKARAADLKEVCKSIKKCQADLMSVESMFGEEEWDQTMMCMESMHMQLDVQADNELAEAKEVFDDFWQGKINAAVYCILAFLNLV